MTFKWIFSYVKIFFNSPCIHHTTCLHSHNLKDNPAFGPRLLGSEILPTQDALAILKVGLDGRDVGLVDKVVDDNSGHSNDLLPPVDMTAIRMRNSIAYSPVMPSSF